MKITAIQCKDFAAFTDVSFVFGNRVFIIGDNYQGKTTIAEAILFGLYGCTLTGSPQTDAWIRKGAKETEVTVTFMVGEQQYEVTRVKGKKSEVYLDGSKSTQSEVEKLLPPKERFLTVFTPGYFTALNDKDARELTMLLVKPPTKEEVVSKLPKSYQELLKFEQLRDPDGRAKELRAEIKVIEAEINKTSGMVEVLTERVKREIPEPLKFNESTLSDLKAKLTELTTGATNEVSQMKVKLATLGADYRTLRAKLKQVPNAPFHDGEHCPTCNTKLTGEALEFALGTHKRDVDAAEQFNSDLLVKLQNLHEEGNRVREELAVLESKSNDDAIAELQSQINDLETEKNRVMVHNSQIGRMRIEVAEDSDQIITCNENIGQLRDEQLQTNETIKAIVEYRAKLAEMQVEQLKKHLNRVDVKLFDVTKSTGEIKPCFTILYDGKEYKTLSRSEGIRCNLEIATMFNKVLGIDVPVYIDNAESITHFDEPDSSQLFTASVVKGSELSVSSDEVTEVAKGDVA